MSKFTSLFRPIAAGHLKTHFGQYAEDVMVRKLFPSDKKDGFYLDLGAYHPFRFSNTALFWLKGWHGINVDANPNTIALFNKVRKKDINLWTAIIAEKELQQGLHKVNLMLPKERFQKNKISAIGTVSTQLSQERAMEDKIEVPATSVNQLLKDHKITSIDYMNVDIEGFDQLIINEFDFSICRPRVISVEDYGQDLGPLLESPITKRLLAEGYQFIARTGPTSIFLQKE